jgi:hypothetical protein
MDAGPVLVGLAVPELLSATCGAAAASPAAVRRRRRAVASTPRPRRFGFVGRGTPRPPPESVAVVVGLCATPAAGPPFDVACPTARRRASSGAARARLASVCRWSSTTRVVARGSPRPAATRSRSSSCRRMGRGAPRADSSCPVGDDPADFGKHYLGLVGRAARGLRPACSYRGRDPAGDTNGSSGARPRRPPSRRRPGRRRRTRASSSSGPGRLPSIPDSARPFYRASSVGRPAACISGAGGGLATGGGDADRRAWHGAPLGRSRERRRGRSSEAVVRSTSRRSRHRLRPGRLLERAAAAVRRPGPSRTALLTAPRPSSRPLSRAAVELLSQAPAQSRWTLSGARPMSGGADRTSPRPGAAGARRAAAAGRQSSRSRRAACARTPTSRLSWRASSRGPLSPGAVLQVARAAREGTPSPRPCRRLLSTAGPDDHEATSRRPRPCGGAVDCLP